MTLSEFPICIDPFRKLNQSVTASYCFLTANLTKHTSLHIRPTVCLA